MATHSPEQIRENIRLWTTENGKFTTSSQSRPNAYFMEYVSYHKPNTVIPMFVAYSKRTDEYKDTLLIGWDWKPYDLDIKAFSSITDPKRKEGIGIAVKNECDSRGLTIGVNPDIYNLSEMAVHKSIHVNELSKDKFMKTITDLMYIWGVLMSQLELHDMSRAAFNASDYI